ncbi:hypothetical protein EXIGLDRAFT_727636 [Exidia glandulosa HHB12029]|uniref:Uncharacterized protein n=1 Tax=Exidia glandulosa HHB12029 TaxID=1314781 RepID=A0A165LZN8_EXIGL|nr:hypothetical protein EXIGLDRAFT_727636 [Exidia glandulosa HHB12029]
MQHTVTFCVCGRALQLATCLVNDTVYSSRSLPHYVVRDVRDDSSSRVTYVASARRALRLWRYLDSPARGHRVCAQLRTFKPSPVIAASLYT